MIKISPSILSSDFANLESEIKKLELAKADMLHIDVMDGHFVKNITIGPPVIKSIKSKTNLPFDVHLMISRPDKYLEQFIEAGSDIITIHYESECDVMSTLIKIKKSGKKAGLALKPSTPAEVILKFLDVVDLILVMTVEPGFGGQKFMFDMLPKIKSVRQYINFSGRAIDLEVDGGINNITNLEAINFGANVIVAGSYIFAEGEYEKRILSLKSY